MPNPPKTLQTLIIEHVEPELDGGRYPIKRIVGEKLDVTADPTWGRLCRFLDRPEPDVPFPWLNRGDDAG